MQSLALSPFAAAILIVSAAALWWMKQRFLHLPSTVTLTMIGALTSLLVIAVDRALPESQLAAQPVTSRAR